MLFVLSLEKPVRQGNTSYHYLVMQIKKDIKESVKLKLPPEQLEQQLNEKLKEEYEGNLHDVVAKVFKSIIKINIIIPGGFERYLSVLCIKLTNSNIVPLNIAVLSVQSKLLKDTCSSLQRVLFSFQNQLSISKLMI